MNPSHPLRTLLLTLLLCTLSSAAFADDNITRITDGVNKAKTLSYVYDVRGRLAMVEQQRSGQVIYNRTDYLHDANGNRTALERRFTKGQVAPDTVDSYTLAPSTNRLASINTASLTRNLIYDNRGNLSTETRGPAVTATTAYDGHGRLIGYARSSEDSLAHTYNGLDDRIATARTPSGGGNADIRRFVTAPDGRAIGEYGTSASDVRAEFIWLSPEVGDSGMFGGDDGLGGYMPIALATAAPGGGTTLTYVHADHLGTPIVITDATGIAIAQPGGYTTPAFPGQSRTLADLYYNRYRDYDPSTGRYIQADPIGLAGGQSPYSYAMGNPVRYIDPTGEFVPLLVIGFLVGFDANLIYQRYMGKGPWQPWKDDNCIDDDIDFSEAFEVGVFTASIVPVGRALKGSEFLFGRHKVGIFNRNDVFRVGKGWKGYPKGSPKGPGRDVFRAALGHRSWPKIPFLPRFPWHF